MLKPFLLLIPLLSTLFFSYGCATLPNVSEKIDQTPQKQKPRQIASSKGMLSPQKSKALMQRLKKSVNHTDILERHTVVVESVTESPLTKGNRVTLLADGKDTYAAMLEIIESAKDHINLESYIIEDDETGDVFARLLLKKQGEGVQVNIIYDSIGSMNTPASFFQHLRDNGIRVVEFNPVNPLNAGEKWGLTHRDHRKILIVDGKVAIIGGINISKVYSSAPHRPDPKRSMPIHWRDTDVKIEGPAAAEFQKLFHDTWAKQNGPELTGRNYFHPVKETGNALVRVIGSTPGETNRIPFVVYVSAISFAEHSVHMTSSYFIPDKQIISALTEAAGRGVDVKIILPGISDSPLALHAQRHFYSELLNSGVRIYEHGSALLHAKTAVIDKVWSTVGSTNMDFLSLLHNDEVNAVILSNEFADAMEVMFGRDLAHSKEIRADEWARRALLPRIREWFVNIFIRWL